MMRKKSALFFLVILSSACVFPAIAKTGGKTCKTLLAVGSKVSRDKEALAKRMARQTGDRLEVISFRQPGDDEVEAAIREADLLITLQRTAGESEAFVAAVATDVTTGTVIGDTAVPTGDEEKQNSDLTAWYGDLKRESSCGQFNVHKLFDRLKASQKCDHVLEIAERMSDVSGPIIDECRSFVAGNRGAGNKDLQHAMSIRFEGVPVKLQPGVFTAVEQTDLDHEVRTATTQLAQLNLACADSCSQGRFLLKIPFDGSWYQARKKGSKDLFKPFEPLMKRLLETRSKCDKALQKLPIQIHLVDVSGETLEIDLGGTKDKPKPKPRTPAESFFKASE